MTTNREFSSICMRAEQHLAESDHQYCGECVKLIREQAQQIDTLLASAKEVADINQLNLEQIMALSTQVATLTQERDLAIAHDRQPYPTAHAYERVCAALSEHKRALASLTEQITGLVEQGFVQHKQDCPHSLPRVKLDLGPGWTQGPSFVKPCTCGLAATLARLGGKE